MIKSEGTRKLKTKRRSERKKHIRSIIGIIVIVSILAIAFYLYNEQKKPVPQVWVTSGPFSINKNQYKIGEIVFMVVSGLNPSEAGNITIVDPKGGTYDTIPFNGTRKSSFNYYFKPNTQRLENLCNPTDLVGNWYIMLKGVPYKSIPFKIINDWIPGTEAEIKPIPKGLTPC
jgi:hypothetical protein